MDYKEELDDANAKLRVMGVLLDKAFSTCPVDLQDTIRQAMGFPHPEEYMGAELVYLTPTLTIYRAYNTFLRTTTHSSLLEWADYVLEVLCPTEIKLPDGSNLKLSYGTHLCCCGNYTQLPRERKNKFRVVKDRYGITA